MFSELAAGAGDSQELVGYGPRQFSKVDFNEPWKVDRPLIVKFCKGLLRSSTNPRYARIAGISWLQRRQALGLARMQGNGSGRAGRPDAPTPQVAHGSFKMMHSVLKKYVLFWKDDL